MAERPCVALVDAYYPLRRLAIAFHEAGFRCVRVLTSAETPLVYRRGEADHDLSIFDGHIYYSGDPDQTAAELAPFEPIAVIPSGESAVEVADLLSEVMGLPSNGTARSPARRNKHLQLETLAEAGIAVAAHIRPSSEDELREWHASRGGRIVVKPIRSAGGDCVSFCDTPHQAVAAYRRIMSTGNIFSQPNEGVVAQEYLVGSEYILDTVSRDGRHHVCDIWRYAKISANGVRDLTVGAQLLPARGEAQDRLTAYAHRVLDALAIQHGPAHIEIKMTPDGPRLIEAAARMAGADLPYYVSVAIGESQINWIVDAYGFPERFAQRCDTPYELRNHFISANLVSAAEGLLIGYPLLDQVRAMETVHDVRIIVAPDTELRRSIDDLSSPMTVNFAHRVEENVLRDFGTLRYLDGPAFYEVKEVVA